MHGHLPNLKPSMKSLSFLKSAMTVATMRMRPKRSFQNAFPIFWSPFDDWKWFDALPGFPFPFIFHCFDGFGVVSATQQLLVRCQFHQHFMSNFFVQNLYVQHFCAKVICATSFYLKFGFILFGTRKLAEHLKCWWNWLQVERHSQNDFYFTRRQYLL